MKNKTTRALKCSLLLLLALVISLSALTLGVSAGDTVKKMVNVTDSNKNMHGPGYEWNNVTKVLTLSGVNIDTDDDYGMRIPKNCTVILKGKNYIKASKYALACSGTVVFKGSGSLTLDAGEIGLYLISQDSTQKVRLLDGKYTINAGKVGVYSDEADFSFIGEKMNVNVSADDGMAIRGRVVNMLGGKFTANAPVSATHALTLDSANVKIDAKSPALTAKTLYLENLSINDYNGECLIDVTSTAPIFGDSIIFGEGTPSYVDYILLVLLLGGIIAAISIPAVRKKKKAEALYKRLEEEGYITK
jgi:hypothetical protein